MRTKIKFNNTAFSITGVLLLFVSYFLDKHIRDLFARINFGFLDLLLGILTNFIIVAVIMLVVPAIILYKGSKKIVKPLWMSFAASIIISIVLKALFARPRPFLIESQLRMLDYSFPSLHSMAAFAVLPFITDNYKFSNMFVFYAMMVAFSRVYFSYHYLSDVVFGIFFGYFLGNAIYTHLGKHEQKT